MEHTLVYCAVESSLVEGGPFVFIRGHGLPPIKLPWEEWQWLVRKVEELHRQHKRIAEWIGEE